MTTKPTPICGEHQVNKEWRPTTFEYEDDGVRVQVPNVPAWVCPRDGAASFTPEVADELIATVRELAAMARKARDRRSAFTEYVA